MKTHITPVQLFFLRFSYLLSGFFLFNITSYYAVTAQFAVFSVFAVLCLRGLSQRRTGLSDFVGAYAPGAAGTVFTGLFLVLSVFQMTRTAVFFSESVQRLSRFLPWWVIFLTVCICAVFAVVHGMTAVGRFSELVPFLLVPMLLIRPFGDFTLTLSAGDFDVSGVLSCVSAAPVFFLASKTLTSGDDGISDAMRVGSEPPANRGAYLVRIMVSAAAAASLVYVYFTLFSFGAADLFLRLFIWMLHIVRLSVLVGIYADLVAENARRGMRIAYSVLFAATAVSMLALTENSMLIARFRLDTVFIWVEFLLPVLLNLLPLIRTRRRTEPLRLRGK